MSNAQDLLSILGGGGARPRANPTSTEKTILSFKAGKMNTELQPNGKYMVSPDNRRGELNLVWTTTTGARNTASTSSGGQLTVEWKDRRTMTTVNTYPIFPNDNATFERVETGNDADRVYLLSCGEHHAHSRHFFWMQDKDDQPDEDNCVNFNLYMSDYSEAALAAGTSAPTNNENEVADDNAELLRIMQVTLISNEEDRHPVDIRVACMSARLRRVLENHGETTEIRLPNVNSAALRTLVEFPVSAELVPQWYANYVNVVSVEQDRLFELLNAAFYMEFEPLMDLTCAAVATVFNGRTLGEMRELLGAISIRLPFDDLLRAHILTHVGSFLHPGSFGVFHVVVNLARNPGAPVPFPTGGLIYVA